MIKIIKQGTRQTVTCETCGCYFSFEREDLVMEDMGNRKDWKEFVTCPQCNGAVIIRQTR